MHRRRGPDIVHRWEGNPIISIEDLSFRCGDICNAGAIKMWEYGDNPHISVDSQIKYRGCPHFYSMS